MGLTLRGLERSKAGSYSVSVLSTNRGNEKFLTMFMYAAMLSCHHRGVNGTW